MNKQSEETFKVTELSHPRLVPSASQPTCCLSLESTYNMHFITFCFPCNIRRGYNYSEKRNFKYIYYSLLLWGGKGTQRNLVALSFCLWASYSVTGSQERVKNLAGFFRFGCRTCTSYLLYFLLVKANKKAMPHLCNSSLQAQEWERCFMICVDSSQYSS